MSKSKFFKSKQSPTPQPYHAIAQQIATRVDALNPEVFMSTENPLQEIFDTVEANERQKRLIKLFSQLPAEQRLTLLEGAFAKDEALCKALDKERERAVKYSAFADSVDQLVVDGHRYKRLDLLRIPDEAPMVIQLYDQPTYEKSNGHVPQTAECYRRIETVARTDGTQLVTKDSRWPGHGQTTIFATNEVGRLGTLLVDSAGVPTELEPMLRSGSPMHFVADEYRVEGPKYEQALCGVMPLVIGQISVGGQAIFRE